MRRKLAYSNPVLTNSTAKLGSLPQGDWHVSKTGGKLFVGDTNWTRYAILGETVNEADFHLDKTTSMLVQAQDKTTCMDIAIESKPAYDIYVVGGGASGLLQRSGRTVLTLRRVTADEDQEPVQRSELRADNTNMEPNGSGCRHAGRQALEIQLSSKFELDTGENVRLSADGADACKRIGVHTLGELGLALLVARWSAGRGRGRGGAGFRRHPGDGRVRGHANRHVLHRVGRVADFAGGWRSYLRLRHRPLLALGLGVAA